MSDATTTRPQPPITADTADWWDATREQVLMVQHCLDCDANQLYPRLLCTSCHGPNLELVPAAGTGVVHTFSVVHRSPDPTAFTAPYVVALVRLDEGPVLTTNIVGADPAQVRCEQPVTVAWEPLEDGRHLPLFTPTPTTQGS